LAGVATVGDLHLAPGGVRHTEYIDRHQSFNGRGRMSSWPAVVTGSSAGFDWWSAQAAATREVNLLCGLLAVAWRSAWRIRSSPADLEVALVIPRFAVFEQHATADETVEPPSGSVPEWAASAWQAMHADAAIRGIVQCYYEGLMVLAEHSSLAHLAFVACVEAVGRQLLGPQSGNGERFRAALRLVASEPEMQEFDRSRRARNDTIHEAQVHQEDTVRGARVLTGFFAGPRDSLEGSVFQMLEYYARRLVIMLLRGELQDAEPVPTPADPFEAWPRGLLAYAMR
jgi:hypothetical protein